MKSNLSLNWIRDSQLKERITVKVWWPGGRRGTMKEEDEEEKGKFFWDIKLSTNNTRSVSIVCILQIGANNSLQFFGFFVFSDGGGGLLPSPSRRRSRIKEYTLSIYYTFQVHSLSSASIRLYYIVKSHFYGNSSLTAPSSSSTVIGSQRQTDTGRDP